MRQAGPRAATDTREILDFTMAEAIAEATRVAIGLECLGPKAPGHRPPGPAPASVILAGCGLAAPSLCGRGNRMRFLLHPWKPCARSRTVGTSPAVP